MDNMVAVIDEEQSALLHERAVECAEAETDADVLRANQELPAPTYKSFKDYIGIRKNLDRLTAITKIEFEIVNSDEEVENFCLAASVALIQNKSIAFGQIKPLIMNGGCFVYAYESSTDKPVGVALYVSESEELSTEWGLMPKARGQGYEKVMQRMIDILSGHEFSY